METSNMGSPKSRRNRRSLKWKEEVSLKSSIFSRIYCILLIAVILLILKFLCGLNKTKSPLITYPTPKRKQTAPKDQSPQTALTACGMPVQNDPIIEVSNLKAYLVGSYIEHRKTMETEKIIKTIAILFRNAKLNFQCLLCCNEKKFSAPATYSIHSDHFEYDYGTADIICQVPKECKTPTLVAVTPQSTEFNESLQNVHVLPVRNQQTRSNFPYEFTVCISTMFDYFNVLQLVQAMEMFKILGVQKVAIYKTSCHPDAQKVLDYYVKQNFVELIPWNISSYINVSRGWQKWVSPGELHYFGQIPALNDCVYRYMYQSRYISLQDLDELILPMSVKNWTELFSIIEKQYGQKAEYRFENNIFPLTIKEINHVSPDSWKKVFGENILEHVYRINNEGRKQKNVKMIINPRLVFSTSVHGILEHAGDPVWVDSKIAKMYHFKKVPLDFLSTNSVIRDSHIRDFADRLIPAVSDVLQQALGIY